MLSAHGHKVRRLVRVRAGPVALGELSAGSVRPLTREEVETLLDSLATGENSRS